MYKKQDARELDEMKKDRIIEKLTCELASSIVVMTKKNRKIRISIDYRKLNQTTQFNAYTTQRVDELLDTIKGDNFITTLDLVKRYWQVPMSPHDRAKTAYTSANGLYQFTVMPFGLNGATATLQGLMNGVL